jgi:hypothetical protein
MSERLARGTDYAGLRPQSKDNVIISTPALAIKYLLSLRRSTVWRGPKSVRTIEYLLTLDEAH